MELQNAKGTRDFAPEEKILRDEVVNTIKETFELYGYNPIETPILERFDVLAAKFAAGEISDAMKETFKLKDQGNRDLGLRYDLTVPFSRFIGMNQQLKMPFKRYQYGDVFRDGPIKLGRYREFFQIDADAVGIKSVILDAEILAITRDVFEKLNIDVVIKVNNRKILDGIMDSLNIDKAKWMEAMIILDKLNKKDVKEIKKELKEKNINEKLLEIINNKDINKLKKIIKNKIGIEGIKEVEDLLEYCSYFNIKNVQFDPSLARGLAYYTGPVFEVWLKDKKINSSLAGGGRFDKMIQQYLGSKQEYPATGISFGIEPIIEYLKLKKKAVKKSVAQIYIIPIGTLRESIIIANELRKKGLKVDMDLQARGISKNLDYANSLGIPYVLFIGPDELKQNKVKLKDMVSGKEKLVSIEEIHI